MERSSREQRDLAVQLEQSKKVEQECQEKLDNDVKELERATKKQSLLLKKVSVYNVTKLTKVLTVNGCHISALHNFHN